MKGQSTPSAVVLVNLGTPDSPTPAAVRRFLRPFLSDPRVVEIPQLLWRIILYLFVLPFRPARVARAYQLIWTERGSPLRFHTEDQVLKLGERLLHRYPHNPPAISHAMSYGAPSIHTTLEDLYRDGHRRILVLPMYPQYSGSTTGSVYDQVAKYMQANRALPGLQIINAYFHEPAYIGALADSISDFWGTHGRAQKLLLSYHGIPRSYVDKGDPYTGHCECTTKAVTEALQLGEKDFEMAYQSRFGKAEWVRPYTDEVIVQLAKSGVKTLDVVCPAFAADCLETLEEIAVQNRQLFIDNGGEELRLIPCLNASPSHIDALENITAKYLDAIIR